MIISFLSGVIFLGILIWLIIRILHFSGIGINGGKTYSFLTSSLNAHSGSAGQYTALQVFCLALLFRIIIYLFETLILFMLTNEHFTFTTFLRRLEIWDSTNYVRITNGYSSYTENGAFTTLVFFPLYPYAAKVINFVIRNIHISLLLTSTLAYAGGCVFLYKLCVYDYGHETAKRAVVYLSIFPFAFFFGAMMSESMLFFTTAMSLYFIRKHKWLLAGLCGLLASMSRLAGVVVIFAAAAEFLEEYQIISLFRKHEFKKLWSVIISKGLYLLLIPLGTVIYLIINKIVAGNFFAFLEYNKQFWGQGSKHLGDCISMTAKNAFNFADIKQSLSMWLPYLLIIILGIVMMIYGMRRNRSIYSAYFLAYFILNTSIRYPISGCRYMTCMIPLFIFLADYASRHKRADTWITVMFSVLFGIYLTAYLNNLII